MKYKRPTKISLMFFNIVKILAIQTLETNKCILAK